MNSTVMEKQMKLFNFILACENKQDTQELYDSINGVFTSNLYLNQICDALMRRYTNDFDKFISAYIACGLERDLMESKTALELLQYCVKANQIPSDNREERLKLFQDLIKLSDELTNENLKISLYCLVASRILSDGFIAEDINLAKKINEFLYNKDTSDINLPSYIMATIGRV